MQGTGNHATLSYIRSRIPDIGNARSNHNFTNILQLFAPELEFTSYRLVNQTPAMVRQIMYLLYIACAVLPGQAGRVSHSSLHAPLSCLKR